MWASLISGIQYKERIHEGFCYRPPDEIYEQGCCPIVEINKKDVEEGDSLFFRELS